MKRLFFLLLTSVLLSSTAHADTIFSNSTNMDFNNVANWSLGLPDVDALAGDDDHGIISTGSIANMSAGYQLSVGRRILITVNGTLNTGANELQLRSGSQGSAPRGTYGDVIVDGGIFNIENGGRVDLAGVGADLFIDNGGVVNFLDGSTMQLSKSLEVLNGSLNLDAGTASGGGLGDELVVDDNGTLQFGFDSGFNSFDLVGSSLAMELGVNSTLSLDFASMPTIGDEFFLVTGVSGFGGVDGGTGTGVFGNVNSSGLGAGQDILVNYNADSLSVSVVSAVPEPASAGVIGLFGLCLAFSRRRRSV